VRYDRSSAGRSVPPRFHQNRDTTITYETAFTVSGAGTGYARRLAGSGELDAPFLWKASSAPPEVESLTGNDLFVDTEAGASDGEAHLMVYDAGCASELGGPWRDMVTGECREP